MINMTPYCIFEDGHPYCFAESWQLVVDTINKRARSNNRYVIEVHNHFIGPILSVDDLCLWLKENGGAFERAIVIHPTDVPPVFMIAHLFAPRLPEKT